MAKINSNLSAAFGKKEKIKFSLIITIGNLSVEIETKTLSFSFFLNLILGEKEKDEIFVTIPTNRFLMIITKEN